MRSAALLLVVLSAVPAAMQAQVCVGQAPWSSGSMKVGGALEFGDGTTFITGTVGIGKDKGMFGSAEAGVATGHGDTGFLVGAGLGLELKRPVTDKLQLCPVGKVRASFGYFDTSEQLLVAGIAAGYPLNTQGNVGVTLTGALQLGFDHFSIDADVCDIQGVDCSSTDFVGELDAGAGIIFNNRISVVPALVIPINSGGDVRFRIGMNVAIGKKGS
jgi:hypothetical protein